MSDSVSFANCALVHKSKSAILVSIPGHGDVWVPQSCVHDDSEVFDESNRTGKLVVMLWWAEKEGMA